VLSFPRVERPGLGRDLESIARATLRHLLAANLDGDKRAALKAAAVELDVLRLHVRLAHDLHLLDTKRYERLVEGIDGTGRMLGGWLKWARGSGPSPSTHPTVPADGESGDAFPGGEA
jgi:hypothetical protein